MSAASIDRSLAAAKDALRSVSTTKPSPLLRISITIRKAAPPLRDQWEYRPSARR
ncbi:MAG: hypothetical protein ABR616_16770 [Dermatophilaceae bacterium]